MIRRCLGPMLCLLCLCSLVVACFGSALFRGEQFGYRDAAHFYYPLYERVQQVWREGRLPLWDARENAGMPLLGNPTAAVLYPGKLIYAALPYAWAARVYIVSHAVLAAVGMYVLMRHFGASRVGATIAGLSYAFGAPILFQYCNVIYLVGAAWVPFGLRAADRWLREGRRWGIVELAVVLAMQVLGGDPQEAYFVGLCAGGLALGLAWSSNPVPGRVSRKMWISGGLMVGISWVLLALLAAWILPKLRSRDRPPPPLPWSPYLPTIIAAVWVLIGLGLIFRWIKKPKPRRIPRMLGGLAGAAALAGLLTAAQLLPVMEYTGRTERAAPDGTHDIYPFSLEPYRLLEMAWPMVFGANTDGHRNWLSMLPPRHRIEFWVPSLYLGLPTLILAIAAFGSRGTTRTWLSTIAALALVVSLGEFTSPIWAARNIPGVADWIGGHDAMDTGPIRRDYFLRDGEGGIYWFLATFLPGFASFRYPSKLLTFWSVGVAGLAAIGWDDLTRIGSRRAVRIAVGLVILSVLSVIAARIGHGAMIRGFERNMVAGISSFGPFEPEAAWGETHRAFLTVAVGGALTAILLAPMFGKLGSKARFVGPLLLILLTGDLILANAHLITTVPQSLFETEPETLQKIREAEARDPSPGPYRIHRMPIWQPSIWGDIASPTRIQDMVAWERKTLQPKYGIPLGVSYTLTEGVGELYDFEWFFSPFPADRYRPNEPLSDANPRMIYYPRRGFDLWNTRYFILPVLQANNENRAIHAFLRDTRPVGGPPPEPVANAWSREQDWQIVRNPAAYPRAWVVHKAEYRRPVPSLRITKELQRLMYEILYERNPYWTEPNLPIFDPHQMAWIEADQSEWERLHRLLSHRPTDPAETVRVVVLEDEFVAIEAVLFSPGLVVLADIFYPGWELTIDGTPAPIYRTNHMMRGAMVPAGPHRLEYRYRPVSVRVGIPLSILGILTLMLAMVWAWRGPRPHGAAPA